MISPLNVAVVAILFASPALAGPGGQGSTVNVNTTTYSVYSDRITEVEVDAVGTHVFPAPFTAPLLSEQSQALATALTALGVPMGTVANVQGTLSIGSDDTYEQIVTSNYNPIDNPDYVIGDPEDYFTWIAIGDEDVNVFVEATTTYYTFYRLLAEIPADCAAGSYSATGQEPCSPCLAGTHQPSTGATTCLNCAPGTFASGTGQVGCTDCGAGTFELDTGSNACDPCPGGQATPCNDNGICSDGPSGNGTCSCDVGYTGVACENAPPTTTTTSTTSTTSMTSTTSTTSTSTTSTTLPSGPCAAVPETGCVVATKAGLQISTNSDPAKNKLKWQLGGGSLAVEHASLGDAAATTSWTLCIYDSTLDVPELAGYLTVGPSASLWTSKDPKGWKYKDKAGSQNGATGLSLKPGLAGKPKAQVKAAGSSLPLPLPVDMTNYFDQDSTVTVQLVKDGGPGGDLCWTSEFDAADTKLNTPTKVKATAK